MKRRTVASILLSAVMLPLIFVSASAFSPDAALGGNASGTIAQTQSTAGLQDGVLRARLGQMLNLNNIYDDDFTSDKTIIENSILALLKYRNGDEIEQGLVLNFIASMYGRNVDPSAAKYDFLPAKAGYFAILPRGYSTVSHEITDLLQDESGITVFSNMTVTPHDSEPYTVAVKTVFVANKASTFGYNIVSSDILQGSIA